MVYESKIKAVDPDAKAALGTEGSTERVAHDGVDIASNLAAGTTGP